MRSIAIGMTLALLTLGAAPLAAADHGLNGRLAGVLSDGTVVEAKLEYISGFGNTQTWEFVWITSGNPTPTSCTGFGSVEVGFASRICPFTFRTGGTGVYHPYPWYLPPDVAEVTVTLGSSSGTAQQVIFPDTPSPLGFLPF